MSRVFVVAAHPDDEVLGCGGTLLRHVSNGDKVYVLFVSDGVSGGIGLTQKIQKQRFQEKFLKEKIWLRK